MAWLFSSPAWGCSRRLRTWCVGGSWNGIGQLSQRLCAFATRSAALATPAAVSHAAGPFEARYNLPSRYRQLRVGSARFAGVLSLNLRQLVCRESRASVSAVRDPFGSISSSRRARCAIASASPIEGISAPRSFAEDVGCCDRTSGLCHTGERVTSCRPSRMPIPMRRSPRWLTT